MARRKVSVLSARGSAADAGGKLGRSDFAFLLLLALAALGCDAAPRSALLITVDTLRADHVSAYGYARATTPEIDRFFAQGTRFELAMSSAPCTVPSVKQLLRGSFDDAAAPLAAALSERGFETAAVVSQHQFYKSADAYRRGFDVFDIQPRDQVDLHGMSARGAREVSDRALEWLAQRPADRPFFLWLHYFDPHDPYEPPREQRGFDAGNRSARSGDRRSDLKREKRTETERARDAGYIFSPEDVAHLVNLYDGEIAYADAQIGRVLRYFDKHGLTRTTAVALSSDHGERLGRENHWDHCASLHDDELRVPLLVRVNGSPLGGGRSVAAPASTLDLAPTLLSLLLEAEAEDARWPAQDLRRIAPQRLALAFWRGRIALRGRDWKLVGSARGESYALVEPAADPNEALDRAAAEPAIATSLRREAERASGLAQRVERVHAREVEELRALGYLE
jgi:arylsulfatase